MHGNSILNGALCLFPIRTWSSPPVFLDHSPLIDMRLEGAPMRSARCALIAHSIFVDSVLFPALLYYLASLRTETSSSPNAPRPLQHWV